jgi:hypothetical protein
MNVNIQKVSNLDGLDAIKRVTDINFGQIALALNGKLAFNENVQSTTPLDVVITAANQVVQVAHNLPFVPTNYLVVYQNAGAVIFVANQSQYQWTQNFAYFTASAAVTARVILF